MKTISIIILAVAIVVLAGVVVWQNLVQSKPSSALPVGNQPATNQDETAGWKTYKNEQFGFEFQYNPNWSIAPINTGLGYDALRTHVLLWAGSVSDIPCQELGCPPKSGDRDELTKGDTLEGAPPLNPWFRILRVRGDKWISIHVTDVSKSCSSEATCQQYLSLVPLTQKLKVDSADYQTYNDFIELISTIKF